MTDLTPTEHIELALIQRDIEDLARVLLGSRDHPDGGEIAFLTVPLVGLVAEESFRYLSRGRIVPLRLATAPTLFDRFSSNVTKARARIKLFDDTDGHMEGLIEALALAHSRSVDSFNKEHRGLRAILRRVQPDLGMKFVGEHLIGTTHAILPALGVTTQEFREGSLDLDSIGERMFDFAFEVGRYLRALGDGVNQDSCPKSSTRMSWPTAAFAPRA